MQIINTDFEGLYVLENKFCADNRGGFQKLFNYDFFKESGLAVDFKEFYYSVNNRDVIRGMHFQTPPCDHAKLVYVSAGRILDVALDIRKESKTYGKSFKIELDAIQGKYLYLSKGFAHGFCSLEDDTIVNYAQTSCYDNAHDCGIDSMSIGIDWGVVLPIRSRRDLSFPIFSEFISPFWK